jgi:hypothetical protein
MPFVRCEKLESYDGGESGNKKCKRGYGGACDGVWSEAVGFVLLRLAANLFHST